MNIINAIDTPCLSSWSHSLPLPPPRQRNHSLTSCLSLGKVLTGKSVHVTGKYVHFLPLCPLLRFTMDKVSELAALHLGRLEENSVLLFLCPRVFSPNLKPLLYS